MNDNGIYTGHSTIIQFSFNLSFRISLPDLILHFHPFHLSELSLHSMHPVILHQYTDGLVAAEFSQNSAPAHFLIFVGGLGDGLLTVPYVPALAEAVAARFGGRVAVVQALISSSYLGFGTGSLERDARELAQLAVYLRTHRGSPDSKVVLMGHSTGCQDAMEYASRLSHRADFDSRARLDGAVLQAPVSDSEAFSSFAPRAELARYLAQAQELVAAGQGRELLPAAALDIVFGAPLLAARFVALAAARGADDYFSSYLTDEDHEKTFGQVQCPLLVLVGGKDEFVPASVDREALVAHWRKNTPARFWSARSKVVAGAVHNAGAGSDAGAMEEVVSTTVEFLADILA